MSLLGDIAAALSEGIGGGMIANAQWGIEEDKQAKKEAADNARLQEQMKRYDADRESRDKYYAAQTDESKAERAARAEQSRLDRESNERIAGMRERSSGGSNADELRGLKFVDGKITDFDTQIGNLMKSYDSEMDPQKQQVIAGQIDVLRAQRKNFITNPATISIMDSSGDFGKAYKAALLTDQQPQNSDKQQPGQNNNQGRTAFIPPQRPNANSDTNTDIEQPKQKPVQTPIWGGITRDNGDSGQSYSNLLHGR